VRHLRPDEFRFVQILLDGLGQKIATDLGSALVEPMKDGGMGSLKFRSTGPASSHSILVEADFKDSDGVLVSVVFWVTDSGEADELDVWKVDYSPLIAFPCQKSSVNFGKWGS
jgi:hypothetical protein